MFLVSENFSETSHKTAFDDWIASEKPKPCISEWKFPFPKVLVQPQMKSNSLITFSNPKSAFHLSSHLLQKLFPLFKILLLILWVSTDQQLFDCLLMKAVTALRRFLILQNKFCCICRKYSKIGVRIGVSFWK